MQEVSNKNVEPTSSEPTFPPPERWPQLSAAERSPKKGLLFLAALTEIWQTNPVCGSRFLTSVKYPVLWEPKEDCAGKGCSQELVGTNLRVCSANEGSSGFSLALFCLNMLLSNMPGGSLGTDFCRIIRDSWPLTHAVGLEIRVTASPCVKQKR